MKVSATVQAPVPIAHVTHLVADLPLLVPLRVRAFLLAWLGKAGNASGDFFSTVVLAGLVLDLTHRTSDWGSILMVRAIPSTLLMLVGGVLSDRFRPTRVMGICSFLIGLTMAGLALLVWAGGLQFWHLYVFATVIGSAYAFSQPANASVVPDLLPDEQVQRGNAVWSMGFELPRFLAPPIAALAIVLLGGASALGIAALIFLVAGVFLYPIQGSSRPRPLRESPLQQVRAGIQAASRDPVVSTILLVIPFYSLGFFGTVGVGLPALAKLTFAAGDQGIGLLYGAIGAGALIGAFIIGTIPEVRRKGLLAALAILGVGLSMVLAGVAPSIWLAVPALACWGGLQSVIATTLVTLLQTRSAPEVRGRVMSLWSLGLALPAPFSQALAGFLGDVLSPRGIILLEGAFIGICGTLVLLSRAMRDLK